MPTLGSVVRILLTLWAWCLPALVFAAGHEAPWYHYEESKFELITTNVPEAALPALKSLEDARAVFEAGYLLKLPAAATAPVRVVAFESEEGYAPYRLHASAFGHYLRGPRRDYMVLQDLNPAHREAVIHEYTHYVQRAAGWVLPLWLSEGMADFYSSLQVNGTTAVIGSSIAGRVATLARGRFIPLAELLGRNRGNTYAGQQEGISLFYAESWALFHMLATDPAYAPQCEAFLSSIAARHSAVEAMEQSFHRSLPRVEEDLRQHVADLSSKDGSIQIAVRPLRQIPTQRELTDLDVQFSLTELMAAQSWTAAAAARDLERLSAEYPNDPRPEELAGFSKLQQGSLTEARAHFIRALRLGSTDGEIAYRLAQMARQSGASSSEVISLLERVQLTSTRGQEASFDLAVMLFNEHRLDQALSALTRISTVRPEWACTYYTLRAYCDLKSLRRESALEFGALALRCANNDQEKQQAARLMEQLTSKTS